MSIGRAARTLAAAAAVIAAAVAAGCDALPDEQQLRFLGFRAPGGADNISVVTGDLSDDSTESVDAVFQNATFTVGRNDDPGVGILVHKARVEYSLQGAPSYEFPVTLFLPPPESKGSTTDGTIFGLPIVPERLKRWIEASGASGRFTATVSFFARTDDGNDLEVKGSIAVDFNDDGGGGGGGGDPGQVTVTIQATTPDVVDALPATDDGVFTVFRTGDTTSAITVNYRVTGSASRGACLTGNGIDYVTLDERLPIAATGGSATIRVDVCPDTTTTEGSETVIVTLNPGAGYTVGQPNSATVTIRDN